MCCWPISWISLTRWSRSDTSNWWHEKYQVTNTNNRSIGGICLTGHQIKETRNKPDLWQSLEEVQGRGGWPLSNAIAVVVEFIQDIHNQGLEYSTINGYRSAVQWYWGKLMESWLDNTTLWREPWLVSSTKLLRNKRRPQHGQWIQRWSYFDNGDHRHREDREKDI